jgi:hypothetical protein
VCNGGVILKITSLLSNNIWRIECTPLPELSTYSLAVTRPSRIIIGLADYSRIVAQIITNRPPCFIFGIKHSGLKASLSVLQI